MYNTASRFMRFSGYDSKSGSCSIACVTATISEAIQGLPAGTGRLGLQRSQVTSSLSLRPGLSVLARSEAVCQQARANVAIPQTSAMCSAVHRRMTCDTNSHSISHVSTSFSPASNC